MPCLVEPCGHAPRRLGPLAAGVRRGVGQRRRSFEVAERPPAATVRAQRLDSRSWWVQQWSCDTDPSRLSQGGGRGGLQRVRFEHAHDRLDVRSGRGETEHGRTGTQGPGIGPGRRHYEKQANQQRRGLLVDCCNSFFVVLLDDVACNHYRRLGDLQQRTTYAPMIAHFVVVICRQEDSLAMIARYQMNEVITRKKHHIDDTRGIGGTGGAENSGSCLDYSRCCCQRHIRPTTTKPEKKSHHLFPPPLWSTTTSESSSSSVGTYDRLLLPGGSAQLCCF